MWKDVAGGAHVRGRNGDPASFLLWFPTHTRSLHHHSDTRLLIPLFIIFFLFISWTIGGFGLP